MEQKNKKDFSAYFTSCLEKENKMDQVALMYFKVA